MGSWTAFLTAYLLGGVTFIPLVIIFVFAHAYFSLPVRTDIDQTAARAGSALNDRSHDKDSIVQPGDDTSALDATRRDGDSKAAAAAMRANQHLDVAAGYFAVCREYTTMGINAKPIERSTPVGSATVAAPSPSVYQTMYRSIFDRKANQPGPTENSNMSQRPKRAGNVFYVILRHGHLMLFDDEEQLEVRHVISLAHHDISIYSGGDVTPEGELHIKRNALCLSRRQDAGELGPDSQVTKPFYLFSENCSAKEDFYFALLRNQEQTFGTTVQAPVPKQFDVKHIISLVQKIHSSEDNVHSRWVNALLGRIFLGIYKTKDLENFIREKLTKKISRVKRPSFLANIAIRKIDTGDAAPFFTNLKLKDLNVEGECVVETDVKYTGNFRLEVAATAKIDLGQRFKAREVNLVLAVLVKRVEGHMHFKIKPPPSNRVWFSFQSMPKMEMEIEPIVSARQITYTVILRQIENRIKEVVAETLVQPFWDDFPFFMTEHKNWRGGIFEGDDAIAGSDEPEPLATAAGQAGDVDGVDRIEGNSDLIAETRPMEKSHSLPVLESQPTATGLFGRKILKPVNTPATSASSTSVDAKASPTIGSPLSPKVIQAHPEPIVRTDSAHADIFKPSSSPPDHATNYMAALHSRTMDASPATTPGAPPPKTDADQTSLSSASSAGKGEAEIVGGDGKTPTTAGRRNTVSSAGSGSAEDGKESQSPSTPSSKSFANQTGSLGRNFFMRRENSNASLSASSASGDSQIAGHKKTALATINNAAAQARQWGWNAIQRQKEARRPSDAANQIDLSQPMGRGQPLPPPGTPLPGPTNGRTRISPIPVPKRKPVAAPPPQPERPSTHPAGEEQSPGSSPATVPSHNTRRRRGASQDQPEDNEPEAMLVVAAPDDSQPGTPALDQPNPLEATDASFPVMPEAITEEAVIDEAEEVEPANAARKTVDPADLPSDTMVNDELRQTDSPVVAVPAAGTSDVEDDDDGYAGWLEDDDTGNEKEPESGGSEAAEQQVNSTQPMQATQAVR